jgi:hypothetical protein
MSGWLDSFTPCCASRRFSRSGRASPQLLPNSIDEPMDDNYMVRDVKNAVEDDQFGDSFVQLAPLLEWIVLNR